MPRGRAACSRYSTSCATEINAMRCSSREQLEVREARGRTVVVQHLADHGDRCATGEAGEVDRRFGVTAPFQHAALAGPQREHVTRAHEVLGTRRGVEDLADRERAVVRADAAARVAVVDRHRERGVAAGDVGRNHRARSPARRAGCVLHGMQTRPRAQRIMKLIASGVTHSAASVRSPSFSRSSSSTTSTISPRRMRRSASSMEVSDTGTVLQLMSSGVGSEPRVRRRRG